METKFESYVDSRTDIRPKELIQAAVDKVRKLGYKNPFDNSTVIDNSVMVEVDNFDGYMYLQSIFTLNRGKGEASKVLKKICDIADEYQVSIVLTPKPFGKDGLTKKQLTDWYKRFGFVKYHLEDMKRQPK